MGGGFAVDGLPSESEPMACLRSSELPRSAHDVVLLEGMPTRLPLRCFLTRAALRSAMPSEYGFTRADDLVPSAGRTTSGKWRSSGRGGGGMAHSTPSAGQTTQLGTWHGSKACQCHGPRNHDVVGLGNFPLGCVWRGLPGLPCRHIRLRHGRPALHGAHMRNDSMLAPNTRIRELLKEAVKHRLGAALHASGQRARKLAGRPLNAADYFKRCC